MTSVLMWISAGSFSLQLMAPRVVVRWKEIDGLSGRGVILVDAGGLCKVWL